MKQQDINSILIKELEIGNKDAWRVAGLLRSAFLTYVREEKKAEKTSVAKTSKAPLTDEARREKLVLKLDAMLDDPKTSAADIKEFRDYFGLGGKKSDVIINITDYKDAYPEGYDKIQIAAKCIELDIKAANP